MITRWKASGIHLIICSLIALSVLSLLLFVWYPQPYFQVMGGKELLFILLGVDLILGPLITLIIYNPLKKSLKFDLAIIATIQLVALVYGLSVLFQSRPVYLVFTVDRFEIVTANEIAADDLSKVTRNEFKKLPLSGPRLVTAIMPADTQERERILFSALGGGADLQAMPQYYVPYEEATNTILEKLKATTQITGKNPGLKSRIDGIVRDAGYDEANLGLIPVRARNKFITALVDRSNAHLVKLVDADPWG